MKVTKKNAQLVIDEATAAASAATDQYLRTTGEHPFNCGFAWVTIRPARGAIVTAMKASGVGRKGYGGGWQVWNPSGTFTQDSSAIYAGAKAYADVLKKYGVDASASSRLD
jgi:hypothetical protein